jgi:hypothetical protein
MRRFLFDFWFVLVLRRINGIATLQRTKISSDIPSQNSTSNNVTLLLPPLFPGERVDQFQLEWRLDSLGIEKLFARDHSYFGIAPSDDYKSLTSLSEISLDPEDQGHDGGDEEREITPLEEIHRDREDSSIKNGDYYLNRKIFFGGHGEIWLAKRLLEDGHLELNTSYVLKRMHLKDRPAILRCALREIYFGELLQTNQRIAKFISHFRLNDDYWLVFRDEGVSLQSILYALTLDRGLPAFEPSSIWKRMRTTLRGEESMRSILYQIFLGEERVNQLESSINHSLSLMLGIHSLHRQGIIHRDIKPSNILINSQSPASSSSNSTSSAPQTTIRLLIADFSSAVDDHVEDLGLYGARGPTVDEVSQLFVSFSLLFSPMLSGK